MRVALITLTRDRLAYTQHCFQTLKDNAGCDYDHYVIDQASTDGTVEWLDQQEDLDVTFLNENLGIAAGINLLLDECLDTADYDVIVRFDNDCEVTQPDTLRDVCRLTLTSGAMLSPRILGLRNPPTVTGEFTIDGETILAVSQIGGIFLAAQAALYRDFRLPEGLPVWGGDDIALCALQRSLGGGIGYVKRLEAWHYESTDGQHETYPAYFERRILEGGPV